MREEERGAPTFLHLARSLGPYGIPLLAHAKTGGENTAALVAFLESLSSES